MITSVRFFSMSHGDHERVGRRGSLTPLKRTFARIHGFVLRVEALVGDVGGLLARMEVPDIDVVGAQLLERRLEVRHHVLGGVARGLRDQEDLLPTSLSAAPTMRSLLPVLVNARQKMK